VPTLQRADQGVPEPQAVYINPARTHTVGIPTAVPKVSTVAEPNVSVVSSAEDVARFGGSVIVHVHGPSDAHTPIDMGATSTVMTAAAVVTSTMASTVTFCIRRRHYSKSERRSDRKNERKVLEHFLVSSGYETHGRTLAKGL
jgi:hypothetical protein